MTEKNNAKHRAWLISLAFIFAIGFFLTALFFHEVRLQKRLATEILQEEAFRLESTLNDRLDHTHKIINKMIFEIKKNPHNKTYINNLMYVYKTKPNFVNDFSWTVFSWTDRKNRIIVDTKYGIMKRPYDLSMRDYIKFTQNYPGKLFLGDPVIGSTSRQWMIPGGVGAFLNDEYLGSMTIGFKIIALANLLQRDMRNSNVSLQLLNSSKRPIFYIQNADYEIYKDFRGEINPKNLAAINKLEQSMQEKFLDIDMSRKNMKAILVKKSKKYPFIFVLKYDERNMAKKLRESYLSKLKISLLILMAIIAITLARKFVFIDFKK